MHVGMAAICQNPFNERSDGDVYRNELRLAELAEPLGFDSLWSVEHHFSDYTMVPDVLQFLTYMAGRTEHIGLGSMVVVLPWHDPIRVAEQVSLLDHVSGGRLILGLGRGAGRREFEGFRVDMGESRERFLEAAQMLLEGLEQGYCEFEGKYVSQPRKDIRPRPERSFKGRTYAAAVSPESGEIMAKLGLGLLVIPQKPWEAIEAEISAYRRIFREVNASDAPPPVAAGWVFCDEDESRARKLATQWISAYWESAIRHYEIGGDHFAKTKGYEFYAQMSANRPESPEAAAEWYLDLQVWGTPRMCYDRVLKVRDRLGADTFVGVFSYAGMPYDESERNLRLFAEQVLPELKKVA